MESFGSSPERTLRNCIILARRYTTCFRIGRRGSEIVGWCYRSTDCHPLGSLRRHRAFNILPQRLSTCLFGIERQHSEIVGWTVAGPFLHHSLAMLLLVFAYYLIRGAYIDASPIPSMDNHSLAKNHCNDLTHCRTIWSIVWSCLVTIFSCTWVAVHPNVPCPKKREASGWIERCIWNPLLSFPSIAFRCSSVRCLCQSTFWHGQLDSS